MRPKKISTSGRATWVASTRSRGSWKVATLSEREWRSAAEAALGAKGSWTWTTSRSRPLSRRFTGSPVLTLSTSWPRRSSSSQSASANRAASPGPPRRTGKTWAIESGSTGVTRWRIGVEEERESAKTRTEDGFSRTRGSSLAGSRRLGRAARQAALAAGVLEDEVLGLLPRLVVGALRVRALHQVAGGPVELAGDAVVKRQLDQPHGVDDDAGRVRRVPHLELQLGGQRHVAEGFALEPDVRPLAVGQPRHVVGGADVDVLGRQLVPHDRGDGVGLRDLLRVQPLALEHVVEVHVAADVELRGPLQPHAAVVEEPRQRPVDDRRPDLALDVVADDRQPGLTEALVPVVLAGDEDRQAVDEADAGGERLLDVPLGRLLGADRQVTDEHVGLGLFEDADDVRGFARGFGDLLFQVLAEAVVGHATVDLDVKIGDVGELDRVVLTRPDRLGEVLADLLGVDVEGGDELDVADVVAAEVDVHQPRDFVGRIGVLVVLDALDEAVGAVADADDRDANLLVGPDAVAAVAVGSVALTH